jgi:hypothetical protein
MYSSFRFKQRQSSLCNAWHKPRVSFASAITAVRSHGHNVPWPVASAIETQIVGRYNGRAPWLGGRRWAPIGTKGSYVFDGLTRVRYTASVVRNVYTPWFGGYRVEPAAPLAEAAAAWESSVAVARVSLARCFAWVGIAEQMDLSLSLLRKELPHLFAHIDPAAFRWQPTSFGAGHPLAANHSRHPYLRSHLLADDYELYDAEVRRLQLRARAAGVGGAAEVATAKVLAAAAAAQEATRAATTAGFYRDEA